MHNSVCMCTCSYIHTATYVVVTCIGLSSSLLHISTIMIPTKIYAFTIPAYLKTGKMKLSGNAKDSAFLNGGFLIGNMQLLGLPTMKNLLLTSLLLK